MNSSMIDPTKLAQFLRAYRAAEAAQEVERDRARYQIEKQKNQERRAEEDRALKAKQREREEDRAMRMYEEKRNEDNNSWFSDDVVEYTYKPGDTFGQVILDLGLNTNNGLWGSDGDVEYYSQQLMDQGVWPNGIRGNIPIGTTIKLRRRPNSN